MPPAVQSLRSLTPGQRPTGRAEGEIYVNLPDKQFGMVDDAGVAQDLAAVRFFSDTAAYTPGDLVVQDALIYSCKTATGPGRFELTAWLPITKPRLPVAAIYIDIGGNNNTADGSQAAPFATLSAAFEYITNHDITGAGVLVSIGPGSFYGSVALFNIVGRPEIVIRGAGVDQTIILSDLFLGGIEASFVFSGVTFKPEAGNGALSISNMAFVNIDGPIAIEMGPNVTNPISVNQNSTLIMDSSGVPIEVRMDGTTLGCWIIVASNNAFIRDGGIWTLTGPPTAYTGWIMLDRWSRYERGASFASITGQIFGQKYQCLTGSMVFTAIGVDYFPGDVAGVTDTSSFYDGVQGTTVVVADGSLARAEAERAKLKAALEAATAGSPVTASAPVASPPSPSRPAPPARPTTPPRPPTRR